LEVCKKICFKERVKNIIKNNTPNPIVYKNNYGVYLYRSLKNEMISYVPRTLAHIAKILTLKELLIFLGINKEWVYLLLLVIL